MTAKLHVLGVRHHGPGSARTVAAALAKFKPDAVLIEGPPDAAGILHHAAAKDMKPPVALLVYEPDKPQEAAYYPFAEFSPEWQAIRWGLKAKAEVRFIDLPFSNRAAKSQVAEAEAGEASESEDEPAAHADPLDALAHAAGLTDGEVWWSRLIEERRGDEDPLGVFDAKYLIRLMQANARMFDKFGA
jgi:hypothetical protein